MTVVSRKNRKLSSGKSFQHKMSNPFAFLLVIVSNIIIVHTCAGTFYFFYIDLFTMSVHLRDLTNTFVSLEIIRYVSRGLHWNSHRLVSFQCESLMMTAQCHSGWRQGSKSDVSV